MKMLPRVLLCCSFLLAMRAHADMRSKWIWIEHGGAVADDAGAFHLMQIIQNTSEQPLWLTVRQGEGASGCEVVAKIEPKKSATFTCDAGQLKARKIPVAIAIFADEAQTQNLETLRDEMRFRRGDLRALADFAIAQRLPVTYEGILFSEKLGVGAVFRQLIPRASGKLEISASAIEYVDGKRSLTIPATSVRRMGRVDAGGVAPWIVVEYRESGGMKRVAFQPLNHPGDVGRILFSIESAVTGAKDGSEAVPGETLGDAGLRRDTVRTILESEKVLAPDCTSPKVVETKLVEQPSNVVVKHSRPVRGEWAERWVVDRCGTQVAYAVSYATDPNGGTFIAIRKP